MLAFQLREIVHISSILKMWLIKTVVSRFWTTSI